MNDNTKIERQEFVIDNNEYKINVEMVKNNLGYFFSAKWQIGLFDFFVRVGLVTADREENEFIYEQLKAEFDIASLHSSPPLIETFKRHTKLPGFQHASFDLHKKRMISFDKYDAKYLLSDLIYEAMEFYYSSGPISNGESK